MFVVYPDPALKLWFCEKYVSVSKAVICVPLTYIFTLSAAVPWVVSNATSIWYQEVGSLNFCVVNKLQTIPDESLW